jgi:hypothetical protein
MPDLYTARLCHMLPMGVAIPFKFSLFCCFLTPKTSRTVRRKEAMPWMPSGQPRRPLYLNLSKKMVSPT